MESIAEWGKRAICKGKTYDFFPEQPSKRLKKYCTEQQCPVIAQCSTYALAHGEHGIWGGTTESDRDETPGFIKWEVRLLFYREGLLEYREHLEGTVEKIKAYLKRLEAQSQEQIDPIEDVAV